MSSERVHGTVTEWFVEDGWGKVRSPELDGEVFVHFSVITDRTGFRELSVGEAVTFTWEEGPQDGCRYRAVDVRGEGREAVPQPEVRRGPSEAYQSWLTLHFDDGRPPITYGPDADPGQPPPEA